jgi:hypothetical protein
VKYDGGRPDFMVKVTPQGLSLKGNSYPFASKPPRKAKEKKPEDEKF